MPLLFLIDQLILEASAEIIQKIVGYFKELKARKIAFEIFWPVNSGSMTWWFVGSGIGSSMTTWPSELKVA